MRKDYDILGIIASLKRLESLPVRTILSGSGTAGTNGIKALQEKIAYLEDLGERIRALRVQGVLPRRIRRQLLGREPAITTFTLGHFSGLRLVQSYLACFLDEERAVRPADEESRA